MRGEGGASCGRNLPPKYTTKPRIKKKEAITLRRESFDCLLNFPLVALFFSFYPVPSCDVSFFPMVRK